MIPQRFVTEFPERCGQLLDMLEGQARKADLVGSFALLVASASFTIPFGRITETRHPLGRSESALSDAIKGLKRCKSFLNAPFWNGNPPELFRYAKILNDPEHAEHWRNADGVHPINSSEKKDANTVLRTIRHALAHGNVVYLDENGHEKPGNSLCFLAFLDKHDDGKSHRVVIFEEEGFLAFLKAWIAWLQTFPKESGFYFEESAA